jgi:hypothetical protein
VWAEFVKAVSAAGAVSARRGDEEDAVQLRQVADQMIRIEESPSSQNVEALLENVVDTLGTIEREIKAERREQTDRESDRETREQTRFVITIYVMIAIFLLQWLLQAPPPSQ